MKLIACTEAEHAQAIVDILNEAIVHSTALYDYHPRPLSSMSTWFQLRRDRGWPVLGLVDDDDTLLGFATWGTFRAWPAYKYTVEHSVYVHADHRGQGLGRVLLTHLIEAAQACEVHTLVGAIDADNQASIALHEHLGFTHAGTVRQAGFKFGRWLDVAFYQLILPTPHRPIDG